MPRPGEYDVSPFVSESFYSAVATLIFSKLGANPTGDGKKEGSIIDVDKCPISDEVYTGVSSLFTLFQIPCSVSVTRVTG